MTFHITRQLTRQLTPQLTPQLTRQELLKVPKWLSKKAHAERRMGYKSNALFRASRVAKRLALLISCECPCGTVTGCDCYMYLDSDRYKQKCQEHVDALLAEMHSLYNTFL